MYLWNRHLLCCRPPPRCATMAVENYLVKWPFPVAPRSSSHTLVPPCHPSNPGVPQSVSTRTSQRDRSCSQSPHWSRRQYHQYPSCSSCHSSWAVRAFFMLHCYIQAFSVTGTSQSSPLVPLQSPSQCVTWLEGDCFGFFFFLFSFVLAFFFWSQRGREIPSTNKVGKQGSRISLQERPAPATSAGNFAQN